jgi:hypothetical protein
MEHRAWFAALLVCSIPASGCALAGVLSAPDREFIQTQEQHRQQELNRLLHQQAIEAHERAVRAHHETATQHSTPPAPEPPAP